MQRRDLNEVVRITNHILTLGLGQDVQRRATDAQSWAQMAKMHPFDSSYRTQLDNSLHELGLILLEIGYLEPMEPKNPPDFEAANPVSC